MYEILKYFLKTCDIASCQCSLGTVDYACRPLDTDMLHVIKMQMCTDIPQFYPPLFKQACDMFLDRGLHMSHEDICYTNAVDVYRFLVHKVT